MVVFIVEDKRVVIPNDKALKSELITQMVKESGESFEFTVPWTYNNIIGNYINFLHGKPTNIITASKIVKCLEMAAHFRDYYYAQYLTYQSYDIWNEVMQGINDLPDDNIKRRIQYYIFTNAPLNFAPDDLFSYIPFSNRNFIKQWLINNEDRKQIVLNKHDVYHIVIESRFHPHDYISCYYSDELGPTDEIEVRQTNYHVFFVARNFYSEYYNNTGKEQFIRTYKNWYPNGNLRDEGTFADGKSHGTQIKWDQHGKVIAESVYNNGILVKEIVKDTSYDMFE